MVAVVWGVVLWWVVEIGRDCDLGGGWLGSERGRVSLWASGGVSIGGREEKKESGRAEESKGRPGRIIKNRSSTPGGDVGAGACRDNKALTWCYDPWKRWPTDEKLAQPDKPESQTGETGNGWKHLDSGTSQLRSPGLGEAAKEAKGTRVLLRFCMRTSRSCFASQRAAAAQLAACCWLVLADAGGCRVMLRGGPAVRRRKAPPGDLQRAGWRLSAIQAASWLCCNLAVSRSRQNRPF